MYRTRAPERSSRSPSPRIGPSHRPVRVRQSVRGRWPPLREGSKRIAAWSHMCLTWPRSCGCGRPPGPEYRPPASRRMGLTLTGLPKSRTILQFAHRAGNLEPPRRTMHRASLGTTGVGNDQHNWTLHVDSGWVGARSSVQVSTPDLPGVPGWSADMAFPPHADVGWSDTRTEHDLPLQGTPTAGRRILRATVSGKLVHDYGSAPCCRCARVLGDRCTFSAQHAFARDRCAARSASSFVGAETTLSSRLSRPLRRDEITILSDEVGNQYWSSSKSAVRPMGGANECIPLQPTSGRARRGCFASHSRRLRRCRPDRRS